MLNIMVTKNIKYYLVAGLVSCGFSLVSTSCSDMLETDSDLIAYEKDHTLNQATDSVYSSLGIVYKLQSIADRIALLGEVRGDLVTTTSTASDDLKRISTFDFTGKNKYNEISDYYAVINNCNYFIAHVDTAMHRRGRQLFLPEYAAAKTFRAWTYLQLALAYGEVPLVLDPVLTERDARQGMNQPNKTLAEICDYFINDLSPLAGVELPKFGEINKMDSRQFFISTRVMLGDLCLWAGRYTDAAKWYHDYLTDVKDPVQLNAYNRIQWPNITDYLYVSDGYFPTSTSEVVTYIPMETKVFDGVVSELPNLYNSTTENRYYYELTPSEGIKNLSSAQNYCFEVKQAGSSADTVYARRSGLSNPLMVGDLRLYSVYSFHSFGQQNEFSEYSNMIQSINKVEKQFVPLYRRTMIYLRYAEALNRAGYPQSAMVVLKYGVCEDYMKQYVDSIEQKAAGNLIYFNPTYFPKTDGDGNLMVCGIHSYGSGDAHADTLYCLPQPKEVLPTRQDTIDYQIPLVEDMIINEMALEGAFEGNRFYDLMRVALRRNKPEYLADAVSKRNGTVDAALRTLLMTEKNWYLPVVK